MKTSTMVPVKLTLAQFAAQMNMHAEPADDSGGVRLFHHGKSRDAYAAAFDLADYAVDAVCGPFFHMRPTAEVKQRLYHRGADGFPTVADAVMREGYGAIPQAVGGRFQRNYGHEVPVAVHGWQFSTTFNRWSALVTFADGWRGFTYPATY